MALALAMWGLSRVAPAAAAGAAPSTLVAIVIALAGGAISAAGIMAFRRARTTIDPLKPERASSLVTGGIYRITRNPMYVGLLLVLVGWAVFLGSLWAGLGPLAFVAYITRFQIKPEERALRLLFGDEFARYTARVRRWL